MAAGKRKIVSVSLSPKALRTLNRLARRYYDGNRSAAIVDSVELMRAERDQSGHWRISHPHIK
jgi:metal-responsive CopG/Arc/MetJ family transcriptional regulator